MHGADADDRAAGSLQAVGTSANGWVCQPPSPPCEPMNSSNGATSLASGSNMQLTRMSGQCGNPSVRRRWSAAFGPKSASGSSPRDHVVAEAPRPAAAEHDRAVARCRTITKPIPGWPVSALSSSGCRGSISPDRHPVLALGQGDQPEAARGEHDRLVLGGRPRRPARWPRGSARARPRRRRAGRGSRARACDRRRCPRRGRR